MTEIRDRVQIFDTTLRDGEQAPGFSMDIDQKQRMARALAALNVDIIEAGFPAASPGDFEAVRAVAAAAAAENSAVTIAGLARANEADIVKAGEALAPAGRKRIHTFIATSPIHREFKLKLSRKEVLERAVAAVKIAKTLAEEVEFSPEDGVRTERDFLVEVAAAVIDAGASVVNVPDTVGYTTPEEIYDLFAFLISETPGAEHALFSAHCHDDLGMAVANSLAAVRAGARQVECAVNGIGERAGNCALEEVVMALKTRGDHFGVSTSVDTTKLYAASQLLQGLTGQIAPRNKAIIGANAFAHEAGIHQDGVLKHAGTYEIMRPEDVGVPKTTLVLGKHSGRSALADRAAGLGQNLAGDRLDEIFAAFKRLADKKKIVTDADIESLILGREVAAAGPWRVAAVAINVEDGAAGAAKATVGLSEDGGAETARTATGAGPIEAAIAAIKAITGVYACLEHYSVRSVGEGSDAQGWADVRLRYKGHSVHGSGVDTDILLASVNAYLDAVNRLIRDAPKPREQPRLKPTSEDAA
ncbi:MAG: 2-isopropylmalate synthase [Parvularculaceae bacterium]